MRIYFCNVLLRNSRLYIQLWIFLETLKHSSTPREMLPDLISIQIFGVRVMLIIRVCSVHCSFWLMESRKLSLQPMEMNSAPLNALLCLQELGVSGALFM